MLRFVAVPRTHISRYLTPALLQSWIPYTHIQISHSGTAPVMNTVHTYPEISLRHCSSHEYRTHRSRYLTPALLQSWIPYPHIQISHPRTAPVMNTLHTYQDISPRHCSSHEYHTHISRYLTPALLQSWIPYTHIQISHPGTAPVMNTVPTDPDISPRHCSSHKYRTHISRYLTPALLQSWRPYPHIQISHSGTASVMNTVPTYPDISLWHCLSHEYRTHRSRYLTPALLQSWIPYPHIQVSHSDTAPVMKTVHTYPDISLRHCLSHEYLHHRQHLRICYTGTASVMNTISTYHDISFQHCLKGQ